jgi:hypothetical protein
MLKKITILAFVPLLLASHFAAAQTVQKVSRQEVLQTLSNASYWEDMVEAEFEIPKGVRNAQYKNNNKPVLTTESSQNDAQRTSRMQVTELSSSSNAYTIIRSFTHQLMTNDKFQTVAWLHRQNIDVFGGSPPTTANGVLRLDLSTDGGETFTKGLGPFNPTPYGPPFFPTPISARARYPQGAFYVPRNAQSPADFSLVWLAAVTDGGGWGNYNYGIAKNLPSFGSNVTDFQSPNNYHNFVSRFQDRRVLIPAGLCNGKDKEFWAIDNSYEPGGNGTTLDSILLWKGVANPVNNRVTWRSYKAFRGDWVKNSSGDNQVSNVNVAFSPDGKWGWAVATAATNKGWDSPQNVFEEYPHFWYSNDSGANWNGPIEVIPRNFRAITDSLYSGLIDAETNDTIWSTRVPIIWGSDLIVDKDGNPHFYALMLNASKARRSRNVRLDVDSIGYASPGFRKVLFDITSSDNGKNWCAKFIASPRTVRGQLAGTQFTYNNYLQVSRNEAGTHIFYSWVDDTSATSATNMRNPNAWERALRISDDAMTEARTWSSTSPQWTGKIYCPTVAPIILTRPDGKFIMPTVFTRIDVDAENPCSFFYIKDRSFTETDFIKPIRDIAISVPASEITVCGDRTFTVRLSYQNTGTEAIRGDTITFRYRINGGTWVSQSINPELISPGSRGDFTFTVPANIEKNGTYVIDIMSLVARDQFCQNSMAQVTIVNFGGQNDQIFEAADAKDCGELTLNTGLGGLSTRWFAANGAQELMEYRNKSLIVLDKTVIPSGTDRIVVEVTGPAVCQGRVLRDTIAIVINDPPVTQLEGLYEVCRANAPINLEATANATANDVVWRWREGNQNRERRENAIAINNWGNYTVTITDKQTGCETIKEVATRVWDINVRINNSPARSCRSYSIRASNASTPEGTGVNYDWYLTGRARVNGEVAERVYNNTLVQSGIASSYPTVLDSGSRAIRYRVEVKDPLGCKTVTDSVSITTFDTVSAGMKVFRTQRGVRGEVTDSVQQGLSFNVDCDTYVEFTNQSKRYSTDFTGLFWRVEAAGGSEIAPGSNIGGPDRMGSSTFAIKWPCNRLGPKAVSIISYSGACSDTVRASFRIGTVGIEEELKMGLELDVYPNPASHICNINLSLKQPDEVALTLWDLNGRLIQSKKLGWLKTETASLDMSALPSGIYMLKVETSKGVTGRRIIKQ